MTFERFENLVKDKHPNARIFKHGEYAGNKINVAIIFNGTYNEKVYKYNGTYCEVLNKLGIKAIYKHDYDAIVSSLEFFKKRNGSINMFSKRAVDYYREIEECIDRLHDIDANYVIV